VETDALAIERKITEIAQIANRALITVGDSPDLNMALAIVRQFATVVPPETRITMDLVTMRPGGTGGGVTVKSGNVTLNMRKLIAAIAGGVLTAVGVSQAPWTAVFGALVVWDSLYSAGTIDLSEKEAAVMWTLWQLKDENNTVADAGLLRYVNITRRQFSRNELSQRELNSALTKLERIGTVERTSKGKSRWWLREWVRVAYH
jgi:hypothetical protein